MANISVLDACILKGKTYSSSSSIWMERQKIRVLNSVCCGGKIRVLNSVCRGGKIMVLNSVCRGGEIRVLNFVCCGGDKECIFRNGLNISTSVHQAIWRHENCI